MAEFFKIKSEELNWLGKDVRWDALGYQLDADIASKIWESLQGETTERKFVACEQLAKDLGLGRNFCAKLFLMVKNRFPEFSGAIDLKPDRKKAFRLFSEFVENEIERLERTAFPENFFEQNLGITYEDFLFGMRNVLKFAEDETEIVMGLNSLVPQLGEWLFSLWVKENAEKKANILVKKAKVLKQLLEFQLAKEK